MLTFADKGGGGKANAEKRRGGQANTDITKNGPKKGSVKLVLKN